jgi:hypothetical protein
MPHEQERDSRRWPLLRTSPSVFILLAGLSFLFLGHRRESSVPADANRLAVVWTSGDPDVAHKMAFMYAHNAKTERWFEEVTLIVWGPSSRLLAGDKDIQGRIKAMIADGVRVQACVVCADMYGVSDRLKALGVEVKSMGPELTDMLKSGWKVLTF